MCIVMFATPAAPVMCNVSDCEIFRNFFPLKITFLLLPLFFRLVNAPQLHTVRVPTKSCQKRIRCGVHHCFPILNGTTGGTSLSPTFKCMSAGIPRPLGYITEITSLRDGRGKQLVIRSNNQTNIFFLFCRDSQKNDVWFHVFIFHLCENTC